MRAAEMNRVAYITHFVDVGFSPERRSLFNAFVSSLSPTEACSALDLNFEQESPRRQAILRKIARDMQTEFGECHYSLIYNLICGCERLPYNKKRACIYCLSYLYHCLPESTQDQLLRFFLDSRYVAIRRTGYKKLRKSWNSSCETLAEDTFRVHQDQECAQLIIDYFSTEYLKENLAVLQEKVVRSPYLARLYLRVAEVVPSILERLFELDKITFAYVCAKLGRSFEHEQALAIFEQNKYDDRLGLLIWCFGQMGLWPVLETIKGQIDKLLDERFRLRIDRLRGVTS